MKTKIKIKKVVVGRSRQAVYNYPRFVGARVPVKIKQLLIEQARIEGLNMSAMIGQALVNYLLNQGTKIEV